MVENVKLDILDAYVCKNNYIKKKNRLKIFLKKNGFTQVFIKTLTTLGFRCRIISYKFLVFAVKILPQKMDLLFCKIIRDNAKFITTNNK